MTEIVRAASAYFPHWKDRRGVTHVGVPVGWPTLCGKNSVGMSWRPQEDPPTCLACVAARGRRP